MDEIQIFQVRVFSVFLRHVLSYAVEHLAGICRDQGFENRRDPAVDL